MPAPSFYLESYINKYKKKIESNKLIIKKDERLQGRKNRFTMEIDTWEEVVNDLQELKDIYIKKQRNKAEGFRK